MSRFGVPEIILVSENSEKTAIGNTPFNVMGAKGFVVTGVILMISFLGMTYQNHLSYAHRIKNMSDQQTLRYNDVSVGFAIFRGKEFQQLEATWNKKCRPINHSKSKWRRIIHILRGNLAVP